MSAKGHFRYGRRNILLVNLWQPMTASNLCERAQAWQNKWAVFKFQGFVCKRFLFSSPPPPSFFFALAPIFAWPKHWNLSETPWKCLLHKIGRGFNLTDLFFKSVCFKEIKEEQDSRVKTKAGETQDSIFREQLFDHLHRFLRFRKGSEFIKEGTYRFQIARLHCSLNYYNASG